MCKGTNKNSDSQAKASKFSFRCKNGIRTDINVGSASLSGNGGAFLIREVERDKGIVSRLASCVEDKRRQGSVKHTVVEMMRAGVFMKCLGYEDCNDCNALRDDPMLCNAVNPDDMETLCSQPTMTRLENSVTEEDLQRLQEMFAKIFVSSYDKEPDEIILDCDDTNIDTHGVQELTLWNTYNDSTCYMPLLFFEGYSGKMILPLLRPGRGNKAANICDTLQWLVGILRRSWKETRIVVRGDSHFCSHEYMEWADEEDRKPGRTLLLYVTGLAQNNVLNNDRIVCLEEEWAKRLYRRSNGPMKLYNSAFYKAGTWAYCHKVVFKVEYTKTASGVDDQNVRYIVTNIIDTPQRLYEHWYCQRGCDELYIREFKESVNACRMSCHSFNANRFRIFMFAAAYSLLHALRSDSMKDTKCEQSALLTIRDRVLRSAVSVRVLRTKIVVDFSAFNPMNKVIGHALGFYEKKSRAAAA